MIISLRELLRVWLYVSGLAGGQVGIGLVFVRRRRLGTGCWVDGFCCCGRVIVLRNRIDV